MGMDEIIKKFKGDWVLGEGEGDEQNFGEYLTAVGVGFLLRKAITFLKPSLNIDVTSDGVWTIQTKSTFKNHSVSFQLDKEEAEKTGDGRHVTSTYKLDGNKLIKNEVAKPPGVSSIMIREVTDDDKLILNLEALVESQGDPKNKVCRRVYRRPDSTSK